MCGSSGSGKSSFIALLLHMLEINEGSVTIDGVGLSTIPRKILRSRLTVIPQEPIFLKGTIRQNIDPLSLAENGSATEDALKDVGLWSIVADAGGLDVPIEADNLLSHRQRQLLCLARAMLRPSKIHLVNKATASVDLQTDKRMQNIISDHFTGYTIVAVAHRLETVKNFDKVAYLRMDELWSMVNQTHFFQMKVANLKRCGIRERCCTALDVGN